MFSGPVSQVPFSPVPCSPLLCFLAFTSLIPTILLLLTSDLIYSVRPSLIIPFPVSITTYKFFGDVFPFHLVSAFPCPVTSSPVFWCQSFSSSMSLSLMPCSLDYSGPLFISSLSLVSTSLLPQFPIVYSLVRSLLILNTSIRHFLVPCFQVT